MCICVLRDLVSSHFKILDLHLQVPLFLWWVTVQARVCVTMMFDRIYRRGIRTSQGRCLVVKEEMLRMNVCPYVICVRCCKWLVHNLASMNGVFILF